MRRPVKAKENYGYLHEGAIFGELHDDPKVRVECVKSITVRVNHLCSRHRKHKRTWEGGDDNKKEAMSSSSILILKKIESYRLVRTLFELRVRRAIGRNLRCEG
jgi:hypothetical protein